MKKKFLQFLRNPLLMHKFQNSRLKTKLLCYFLSLVTIPLIGVGCFTYFFVEKVIERSTSQSVNQTLVQANETIEYYLRDLVNVAAVLNVNEQFKNMIKLEDEPLSQYEKIKNEYAITNLLSSIVNTKREIYSVAVFTDRSTYVSGSGNLDGMRKTGWFKSIREEKADKIFIANNSIFISSQPKYVYSLACTLKDITNGKRLGVVVVNLDDKIIRRVLDKIDFGSKSSIFMLDQSNQIVYSRENNLLQNVDKKILDLINKGSDHTIQRIDGEKYFIIMHTSSYSNWNIVWFIPYKVLIAKAVEIRNTIFLITIICIAVAFVISLTLASNITIPIKHLITDMNRVQQGDLAVRVNYRNFYELGQLSDNFNNMITEIKGLIQKVYDEQNAKRKAEIRVLETQINPHFLYNTLDSIKWVAILQKAENVGSMITSLVKLLQISLSGGSEFIDVAHELEHVKNYLEIQQFRYNDRFDAVFDIPDEILKYKTLKVILQPLVENALFYGIEPKKVKGTITISGGIEGDTLFLIVKDDGVGMDCSSIEDLLKRQKDSKNRMYKGIGIRNIDERIKLYFGNEFGVEFLSESGKGTQVKIRLPLIKQVEG